MTTTTLVNKPVRPTTQSSLTLVQEKKVSTFPIHKEEKLVEVQVHSDGYVHGATPSIQSSRLELNVAKALIELGATTPDFLKWKIGELLDFIHKDVVYQKPSPRKWNNIGQMMTECTLENMGKSHPHITSWSQLSLKEAIDFMLGVDIVVDIVLPIGPQGVMKKVRIAVDATANPGVVDKKREKAEHAYKGARRDVLVALKCDYYVVVLGEFDKDIGPKKLLEKLSNLGEEKITSVSLVRPKKVITLAPSGPKLEELSEVI